MTSSPPDMEKLAGELLPCPFCGGAPVVVKIEPHSHAGGIADFMPDHPGSAYIDCTCGVGLIDASKEDVVKRWNARTPASPESTDADNARAWHQCVETMLTLAGLSCALSPSEAVVEFQKYVTAEPALDARTVEDNSVNREIAMDQILTLSRELGAVTERLMQSERAYRALERKSAKERRKLESEVFIANSPIREDREG